MNWGVVAFKRSGVVAAKFMSFVVLSRNSTAGNLSKPTDRTDK
jgi:hypothetical protein